MTANWEADSDNTWTVPVGGGVGRLFRIGKLPVNMQVQGFYSVEKHRVARRVAAHGDFFWLLFFFAKEK